MKTPFVKRLRAFLKRNAAPLLLSTLLITAVSFVATVEMKRESLSYSDFSQAVEQGKVKSVVFVGNDNELRGKFKNGHEFKLQYPSGMKDKLPDRLAAEDITISVKDPRFWDIAFRYVLPMVALVAIISLFIKKNRAPKHKAWSREIPKERLEDVVGATSAVEECRQVVHFLQDPTDFERRGIVLERGFIFYGPPGTGKTTLARALAGSAQVPFFGLSGAEFSEAYAGQTTVKIREMLDDVIAHDGPCVVFVNELDVAADKRTDGIGANRDRNEAVAQLFTKFDEVFGKNPYAVIIADTNRLDQVDPAVKRKGRLGVHIPMPNPDFGGREELLRRKSQGIQDLGDIEYGQLARLSAGMSGADLTTIPARAALLAYLEGASSVETRHFVEALAEAALGKPQKNRHVSAADEHTTAVHEAGHALVAARLEDCGRSPYRVTIVPVGSTGGSTWLIGNDSPYMTRETALAELAVMMAGAAAEKLATWENRLTSGPADDRQKATMLARTMVCEWAMGSISDSINPENLENDPRAAALLREVEQLLTNAEAQASEVLKANRGALNYLVEELLEHRTLSGRELADVIGPEGVITLT